MAGEVEVIICQGKSKDPRFDFYPYWRLKIIDDNKKDEVMVTLTYQQMRDMLKKIFLHEYRVDEVRQRNPDFVKYKRFLREEIQSFIEQLELGHFTPIPKIYYDFKQIGYSEKIKLPIKRKKEVEI